MVSEVAGGSSKPGGFCELAFASSGFGVITYAQRGQRARLRHIGVDVTGGDLRSEPCGGSEGSRGCGECHEARSRTDIIEGGTCTRQRRNSICVRGVSFGDSEEEEVGVQSHA